MSKPLILVTCGRLNRAAAVNEVQAVHTSVNVDYVESVVRAGGAPILLPRMADMETVRAAVAVADGLLLTGGGDVCALNYGEEPHPRAMLQDPTRDEVEITAARAALERGLPVLGICRGIQVLTVAGGGTLFQDIPSQIANPIQHYTHAQDTILAHTIRIEPDSLLARVLGVSQTAVNTYHHQSVKDLAPGYRVSATAPDGVIEAMESSDSRRVLAVQFHPEELTERYPLFLTLFEWLVAEATRRS